MATHIVSRLVVTGQGFDPDEITRATGITPTKTWRAGDRIQSTTLTRAHDGWSLATPREECLDAGSQIKELLRSLGADLAGLPRLRRELALEIEIACALYVSSETPSMHLDRETLRIVERLAAEIDFDLYLDAG